MDVRCADLQSKEARVPLPQLSCRIPRWTSDREDFLRDVDLTYKGCPVTLARGAGGETAANESFANLQIPFMDNRHGPSVEALVSSLA